MSEPVSITGLVVASERPQTIFIGTRSRFRKGAGHVWRYELSSVGSQRIYVCLQPPSTTHANDVMFTIDWRGRHRPDTLLYLWDLIGFD